MIFMMINQKMLEMTNAPSSKPDQDNQKQNKNQMLKISEKVDEIFHQKSSIYAYDMAINHEP